MRIYAASSWRNERHPEVVVALRVAGFEVYDFRHPELDNDGFSWDEIDPDWHTTTDPRRLRDLLAHPVAVEGYRLDMEALEAADICVLTLPCGRSAHLELGYAVGAGKPTAVLLDEESGPELMYRMVGSLCTDLPELVETLKRWRMQAPRES